MNAVILRPPAAVTVNQWKDGSLHFRVAPAQYLALADVLAKLAMDCQIYAQAYASQAAAQRQEAGPAPEAAARIAEMEAEIARLRGSGVPVSVNTNPVLHPAHQLAAAVTTRNPVTVAAPGPSVFEVAQQLQNKNHPQASMHQAPALTAPLPPPPVVHMPTLTPPAPVLSLAHLNTGPQLAGSVPVMPDPTAVNSLTSALPVAQQAAPTLPPGTVHIPILQRLKEQAGTAAPDAPGTIVSGGLEVDDGELGAPPASI